MTIAFRSIGAFGTGTTAVAPALPAGFQAGDLFVAALWNAGGSAQQISTPSGWTIVDSSASTTGQAAMFFRYAQAGDTSPTFNSVNAGELSGWIAAFQRVKTSSPVHVHNADISTVCAAFDVPALSITLPNTLVVSLARRALPSGWAGGVVTPSPPAGFTLAASHTASSPFANLGGFAYQIQSAADPFATDEATWSMDQAVGTAPCSCVAAAFLAAAGVARAPIAGPLALGLVA